VNPEKIPFLDLARQEREISQETQEAFARVAASGIFILGPEVAAFEREFADYCGAPYGVGVASGTDALVLALMAMGLKPGDEVLVPAFSAPPTVVAIALAGGRPVFVDIDPTSYNIDSGLIEASVAPGARFLLVVHLYGGMADMPRIMEVAAEHGLAVIEDCAQAHGAALAGKKAGTWGEAGSYSFYPTKNLGAYGDSGLVVTGDEGMAARLRHLRNYGKSSRDRLEEVGLNSRLDEVHAAILRVKLGRLDAWNRRRKELASRYLEGLGGLPLRLPEWKGGDEHCFHLFVVACEDREGLSNHLENNGIQSKIHYSIPLHLQKPFAGSGGRPCPQAERAARTVLSLPLYPGLREEEQDRVIAAVREYLV
jgi:dTDP-4-amino-4,6-dideoxygalactose transaminase